MENWYSSLGLAAYYVQRDLHELGTAGAKDLHDGLLRAHLQYIATNTPSDTELNLMTSSLLPKNIKTE